MGAIIWLSIKPKLLNSDNQQCSQNISPFIFQMVIACSCHDFGSKANTSIFYVYDYHILMIQRHQKRKIKSVLILECWWKKGGVHFMK